MNRKIKFKENEILEVELESGSLGYCRVLKKDNFGVLLKIYENKLDKSPDIKNFIDCTFKTKCLAYLNRYTVDEKWKHLYNLDCRDYYNDNLPKMFLGTEVHGYQIDPHGAEINESIKGLSYEQLIEKGYLHKVLWRASKIKDAIDTEAPLVFAIKAGQ